MTPSPPPSERPLAPEVVQDAAGIFALLAAAVRVELIWLLAAGECDVGTLADAVGESVPTVSHHLGKLRLAGLVSARRAGRRQIYAVDDPHIVELVRQAVAHQQGRRTARQGRRREA